MIKYVATALTLKAFSISAPTRRFYRYLGNALGGRGRAQGQMPSYYIERVQRMLDLAKRYQLLHDGSKLLELGTGWMHWEALTTRLFFKVEADLYDVWDNRQLDALKGYLGQLIQNFDQLTGVTPEEKKHALALADEIKQARDFAALYQLLGFRYVLDPKGTLENLPDNTYDVVVSAGVFEHLPRAGVPDYIRQTYRVLQPGGYAIHSINTTDHLHLYDRSANPKYYLQFSDKQWEFYYENELQYINRLQRCEWMTIFSQAGFACSEEFGSRCDISQLKVSPQFRSMDQQSLETTAWFAVYRKPPGAGAAG